MSIGGPAPEPRTCAAFLAAALPRLGLDPAGYRRVRRQICRRLARRLQQLQLADFAQYLHHLAAHPGEWDEVDAAAHITISRFYRDRAVFDRLALEIMPALAGAARHDARGALRAWSAGCASGEEPYSVVLAWMSLAAPAREGLSLEVVATDIDDQVLARARAAVYPSGCLRDLPRQVVERAFVAAGRSLRLRDEFRPAVTFLRQDLRSAAPEGPFDLVLCRNLAFTYFDQAGRRAALARLSSALHRGGALVIGRRERLPSDHWPMEPWLPELGIFRRDGAAPTRGPGENSHRQR